MSGGSSVRAVLFDAAGTLLHPREPVGETYARFARAHGVELPASRLEEAFGRILAAAPTMVFSDAPPDRVAALERGWWRDRVREVFRAADATARFDDFESFFEALYAHFADAHAWSPAPGARTGLEALRREGRRLGVVSNFDGRLPALLAGLGLAPLLECVVLPRDAGVAKPDPRIFARALALLGASAHEAVYVGDHPRDDLQAARAAGLRALDATGLATLAELPDRIHRLEDPRP